MKKLKILSCLMLLLLLFSCTTFKTVNEDDAFKVIEMINEADVESLVDHSSLPFAFESEILASESQLKTLWSGLTENFVIDNPVVIQNTAVIPEDYSLFYESWEIQTYFKRLLTPEDKILVVDSSSQNVYFILGYRDKNFKILGLKVGER